MKKAIIVGAGLGGLATAVRLQHQGFQTIILEKNSRVGGRCDIWQQDGFTFDTGPSILLMPDVFHELFRSVGRELRDYIDLIRLPFNYRVTFGDGTSLDVSCDDFAMRRQLDAMEPGAGAQYLRFLEDAGYKYRTARQRFTDRNFRTWAEFLTPLNFCYLLRVNALVKLSDFVARYFTDPRIQISLTFQTMYLGLAPRDAPAIYSLLPYTELVEGIWYPMGGVYQIPMALQTLLAELGGEVRTGCTVEEVLVRRRRASGVRLASGEELQADVVICNADLPQSYRSIVPPAFRAPYENGALDRLRYGCSAFMLYLGVDRVYDHLFHHNVYLAADVERNFEQIFREERLPDDPSFYVHCAARTDPNVAPAGSDAIYVLAPVPHLGPNVDWAVQGQCFRERVLDRVEALAAPGIRRHIKVERMITPADWSCTYNLRHGATFGLSHDFFQVGYMRPRNKAAGLGNLYFVGAGTVPGGGVPMVFIGSKLVAERVQQEVGPA